VDEIAAHLGFNPESIDKRIARKGTPAHQLGRRWGFVAPEAADRIKARKAAEESNPASTRTASDGSSRREVPDD
jgi:hypothetical protein